MNQEHEGNWCHNMKIVDYSEHSIVVIGDTKEHKEQLKQLGGKYNPKLTISGEKVIGWVFSNKNKDSVIKFLNSGYSNTPSDQKIDYDFLMNLITNLESRVKSLEEYVGSINTDKTDIVNTTEANRTTSVTTKRLIKKK